MLAACKGWQKWSHSMFYRKTRHRGEGRVMSAWILTCLVLANTVQRNKPGIYEGLRVKRSQHAISQKTVLWLITLFFTLPLYAVIFTIDFIIHDFRVCQKLKQTLHNSSLSGAVHAAQITSITPYLLDQQVKGTSTAAMVGLWWVLWWRQLLKSPSLSLPNVCSMNWALTTLTLISHHQ